MSAVRAVSIIHIYPHLSLTGKGHPSGVHPLLQLQDALLPHPAQGYPHALQGFTQGLLK